MEETIESAARLRWRSTETAAAAWLVRLAPVWFSLVVATMLTIPAVMSDLGFAFLGWDARAYYDALRSPEPYAGAAVGVIGSFLYPPPFLQILAPLGQLSWPAFMFGWTAMLTAAAVTMIRRVPRQYRVLWPFLFLLAGADVYAGNINLFLAYGAVLGLTIPVAWAGLALTKVTPGLGALWLGFKGRWVDFAIALGVTAVIAVLSFSADTILWGDWLSVVFNEDPAGAYAFTIPVPLFVRLPIAVIVLWWAARTDRPWLVPVACLIALPVIWLNGMSLLVGAAALWGDRARQNASEAAVPLG